MGSPIYRERYLAALEVAHSDLNQIIEQFDMLQLRKEQLEEALDALDPFLRSAPRARYEARQSESIHLEPVKVEREKEIVQPVLHMEAPEPVDPGRVLADARADSRSDPEPHQPRSWPRGRLTFNEPVRRSARDRIREQPSGPYSS